MTGRSAARSASPSGSACTTRPARSATSNASPAGAGTIVTAASVRNPVSTARTRGTAPPSAGSALPESSDPEEVAVVGEEPGDAPPPPSSPQPASTVRTATARNATQGGDEHGSPLTGSLRHRSSLSATTPGEWSARPPGGSGVGLRTHPSGNVVGREPLAHLRARGRPLCRGTQAAPLRRGVDRLRAARSGADPAARSTCVHHHGRRREGDELGGGVGDQRSHPDRAQLLRQQDVGGRRPRGTTCAPR